jgi:hypothetical protein
MGPISVLQKTESEITLAWAPLDGSIQTGDSEILAYNLYWDNASEELPTIRLLSSLETQFKVKGTKGGLSYTFVVKAENIFGEGMASE